MKYIKKITCIKCKKTIEVPVTKMNIHGFIKRKCPFCKARWRVGKQSLMVVDK